MERCFKVWNILMVNDLFSFEESVVVNMVLLAMLVSPEQFIVSWIL